MLDVIHYYFETENSFFSEEHMKSMSKIREVLYEDMYGRTYKYKHEEKKTTNAQSPTVDDYLSDGFAGFDDEAPVKAFNPMETNLPPIQEETKINTSAANPYDGILEPPMG